MSHRTETITIRCSHAEKATFKRAAEEAGLSISELGRRSIKVVDPKQLGGPEPEFPKVYVAPPLAPELSSDWVRPFRTPFLKGLDGYGFECAVRFAARRMRADDMTVAMCLSYFGEAMANSIIRGQVFRFPGLFVAGGYAATSRDGRTRVWPRLQACPPLSRFVNDSCPPELARNKQLDAHWRRSRRAGVQTVPEFMQSFRRSVVNQDLAAQKAFEDHWHLQSRAHAV